MIPHITQQASKEKWDSEELKRLLMLIFNQMEMDFTGDKNKNNLLKFLSTVYYIVNPDLLADLDDEDITLSPVEIISLVVMCCEQSGESFILVMDAWLDSNILDLCEDNLYLLYVKAESMDMPPEDFLAFTAMVCGHAESKKQFGQILKVFTSR